MKQLPVLVICLLLMAACRSAKVDTNAQLYRAAIKESMYPETDKVDTTLIRLTPDNPELIRKTINGEEHILMVTWKATNYYPDSGSYNTGNYQIWVTAAPQLLNRFKKEKAVDTAMRLKQLLGLPPNGNYKIFVEFWVKPSDMFRPCPDKEVTDGRCNTCFTANDSIDPDYIKWVNDTRIARYYQADLYNQYPWTVLGYTYDWHPNNKSHIGLCEFVIDKNRTVYVNRIYSTAEYLQK